MKEQNYFAHETAVIDENCNISPGTKIWHFSHIMSGSKIGENCNLGQNVLVSDDVILGNNVKVQNNVSIYKGITLEDGVGTQGLVDVVQNRHITGLVEIVDAQQLLESQNTFLGQRC